MIRELDANLLIEYFDQNFSFVSYLKFSTKVYSDYGRLIVKFYRFLSSVYCYFSGKNRFLTL